MTPSKNVNKDSKSGPFVKRRKLPEEAQICESGELKLFFSPEKKPKNNFPTVKKPDALPSSQDLDLPNSNGTPTICEALGLRRSGNSPLTAKPPETNKTPETDFAKPINENSKSIKGEDKSQVINKTPETCPANTDVENSKLIRSDKSAVKTKTQEINKTPETASVIPVVENSEPIMITKNMLLSPEKSVKKALRGNQDDKVAAKKPKKELDLNRLAKESAKILSTLQSIKKPAEKSNTVDVIASSQDSSTDSRCQKTELFVFQNKLPFGMFEEDL